MDALCQKEKSPVLQIVRRGEGFRYPTGRRRKGAPFSAGQGRTKAIREAVRQAIDTSFVSGFRELMLISAALAVLSAIAAALMIRSAHPLQNRSRAN